MHRPFTFNFSHLIVYSYVAKRPGWSNGKGGSILTIMFKLACAKPENPPEMLKFSETHHMLEICRPVYKQIPPENSRIEIEGQGLT